MTRSRFAIPVLLFLAVSCSLLPEPRPAHRISLASWNVENLFDEVADGGEYAEFEPAKGWSRAQFWSRCQALAKVIRVLSPGGADLLVLHEVEGARALETLNGRFLRDLGYQYSFLAPPSVPGIKTAVLSRFPLVRTGLIFPGDGASPEPLRPLVEVEINLGGRSLIVIGNHWKSRLPSPEATEGLRRQSADRLCERIAELELRADHPFIVALGDFNTSAELSRPWSDRALVSAGTGENAVGGLPVYSARLKALQGPVRGSVWDPWETTGDGVGSYWYQGKWSRLDHAFVAAASLSLPDWSYEGFAVVDYAARPLAYQPQRPGGVSDHFPIVLSLVRQ